MSNSKGVFFVIVLSFLVLGGLVFFSFGESQSLDASNYLRIHIRANSNSCEDQTVKYEIKDKVVEKLAPLLSDAKTKKQAVTIIQNNLTMITSTVDLLLEEKGFNYKSSASIKSEYFPTRTYDSLTLSSDVYDALIINLGTGKGDNWWCVAYPPMCFVNFDNGSENVVYKSKLVEIVENFFKS